MEQRLDGVEGPAAEAGWIGSGAAATFALLHQPRGRARDTAVLITPPFGWSEVCSYRDRRTWACAFADAGFATARVALPGTGDSGGLPTDDGLLDTWRRAIASAAGWLREATGARRIAVLGIGLGGLLACAAAQEDAPIDDFILWGVVARGSALVRQEQAYAGVIMSISDQIDFERVLPDGSLQLTGYRLAPPVLEQLRALELDPRRIARAADARVLLLDRDGLPVDARVERGFREAGAEVETLATTDWVEFISPAGEKSEAPPASIAPTVAWLTGIDGEDGRAVSRNLVPAAPAEETIVAPGVRERILHLDGPLAGCLAIATEPADGIEREPLTAVFLHAYHTGPGRMWVEVARRWAARGVTVVRADLPGMHESSGASPRQIRDPYLYRDEEIADTVELLAAVRRQGLPSRTVLGGFCAGAFWALHAALGDPQVAQLLLVNLWIVRWDDRVVSERMSLERSGNVGRRTVRRLRAGELRLADVREGVRRLLDERRAADRPVQRTQNDELMRLLGRLGEQGTETTLVFTEREALLDQIRYDGSLARIAGLPRVRVEAMPVVDHNLWALSVQASVHAALDRALAPNPTDAYAPGVAG